MDPEEKVEQNAPSEKPTCFVIMPISDNDDYPKGHFDRVYNHLIKPACELAGYEPYRADDTAKTNDIVADIVRKIINSEMAICDMSSRNPNVFYELGLRHAFNLKTVLMKDKRTPRPFDITTLRTVDYDESLRIDTVETAIKELVKAVEETANMTAYEANSTIQLLGIDAPAKKIEPKDVDGNTAIILNEIRGLQRELSTLYNKVEHNDTLHDISRIGFSEARCDDSSIIDGSTGTINILGRRRIITPSTNKQEYELVK